ncbi:MAG: RNA 2',3'-cyclic phosphodiesterase [Chloroflexi bacterium]|nr:RNA 2',3'-cyclic phosphodiesterase [Chloroflexota bacterium]
MNSPIRTFIAIDIPPQAKDILAVAINGLQERGVSEVRWTRPQGVHLTLKFLGDIDPGLVDGITDELKAAAQGEESFGLSLGSLGVFPTPTNPRVIWVGLEGDLEVLKRLQEAVEEHISPLGFPRDKRGFTPHLTLGRVRNGLPSQKRREMGQALKKEHAIPTHRWEVQEIHLIHSTLTPEGAVYRKLGTAHLKGNPSIPSSGQAGSG